MWTNKRTTAAKEKMLVAIINEFPCGNRWLPRSTRAGVTCHPYFSRLRRLFATDRLALRREHADSWATEIHDQCVSLRKTTLPKSALGQAVTYTLNMWPKLRRCFDYAEVELSNNLAENSMRPVALGRKNWLHVGSPQSGPKVAAILSVVESCRRLGLPVKGYLQAVLPGMARRNLSDLTHLTPARWAASRN